MSNNKPTQVLQTLKESKKPIMCIDSRPDFDCFCSAIIMYDYMTEKLGKNVKVTFDGQIGESFIKILSDYYDLSFMDHNISPSRDIDFSDYDLQIFLDSGNIEHISVDEKYDKDTKIKKLNIDHHSGNSLYGDVNYVKRYTSTCSVLYELYSSLDIEINSKMSNIFYLGLVTDSGFFQFNTVTAYDHIVAAGLIGLGVDHYDIIWKLTFNESIDNLKFKGLVYSNLTQVEELKTAYSTVSLSDIHKLDIDENKVYVRASDLIKKLDSVDFVFVVTELPDKNLYNLSFRSHNESFDVLELVQELNGGGHKMAAGANIQANSMSDAVKITVDFLKNYLKFKQTS